MMLNVASNFVRRSTGNIRTSMSSSIVHFSSKKGVDKETQQLSHNSSINFDDKAVFHSGPKIDKLAKSKDDRRVGVYSTSGHVNLNSVTNSTVPKPYEGSRKGDISSAQKNVLGSKFGHGVKLVSSNVKGSHQNRNYSSLAKNGANLMTNFAYNYNNDTCTYHSLSQPKTTANSNNLACMKFLKRFSSSENSPKEKFKKAIKEYGSTVIVFHVAISLTSLGLFYVAVSSGLDVAKLLSFIGASESIINSKAATGASTFVVAYAVHKVFAPARIAITLTATPLIVRHLRRIGFLSKPSSKK